MANPIDRVSKKLVAAGGFLTWLLNAPLPDEVKAKYGGGITLVYLIVQGVIDAVGKWKGRKAITGSNAPETGTAP